MADEKEDRSAGQREDQAEECPGRRDAVPGEPWPDETITTDSMVMALRSTFRPESAGTLRAAYELRLGDVVVHARVKDRRVEAAAGPLPDADLTIEAGPGIRALMAGEITPAQALQTGALRVRGKRQLLSRFAEVFKI